MHPWQVKFKKGPDKHELLKVGSRMPRLGKGAMADLSWTAAFPLITSWLYKYYADTYPIMKHWDSLKKYMDGVHDQASKDPGGLPAFWTWGDWCAVEARAIATPATGPELAAFNYILGLDAMVTMADAVGEKEDAEKYKSLGTSMRVAFKEAFYNATLDRYAPRGNEADNELLLQSLNVAPLAMAGSRPDVADSLGVDGLATKLHENIVKQDYHLTVGSVGAKHLLPQLSANGLHEDAMKIATQQTYPSYGWWIANGATTCWENYEGWPDPEHPPTPTHNHIFLCGGAGEWMYRSVLGIEPASAGWKKITVAPHILADGPASATGSMATIRGKVSVAWTRADSTGQRAATPAVSKLAVTIPAGATATVTIPCDETSQTTITESGKTVWTNGKFVDGVTGVGESKEQVLDGVTFEVESGSYSFAQ
jgi:alpha-L-rhamnosidase|eukprot:COSAG02_NODE_751_length_17653_cov_172.765011_13_plen_424_part_00